MSIAINVDLEYLKTRLHIPETRFSNYENKSVSEILQAEAAMGNQEAIKLAADMFTDVNQLIELFQLADPTNKLAIMHAMNTSQLEKMIPLLEEDDLVQGLNYFNQDALLKMLKDIPKEQLVNTVFQMFSEQQLIEYMPEKELDALLTNIDMDKNFLLKGLQTLPEMYLQQILESVTGEEAQGPTSELILQISQLGDADYKNAILNLEPSQKKTLTYILANQEKKLYENFGTDSYLHIINREKQKPELVKAMGVIEPEHLQNMMANLPEDLLSIVLTQIDPEKFADSLITKYPEVLAKFVAG